MYKILCHFCCSIVQFTIHEDVNISCQENSVYVYDGLPDFVSSTNSHQSHVLGVFCSVDTKYPVTVEAKSGELVNTQNNFSCKYL